MDPWRLAHVHAIAHIHNCAMPRRACADQDVGVILRIMPGVTVRAHYDGERIQLDEPFDLPTDVPLLVTVLPAQSDDERAGWLAAGKQALARAFGDHEPEYTRSDIKR